MSSWRHILSWEEIRVNEARTLQELQQFLKPNQVWTTGAITSPPRASHLFCGPDIDVSLIREGDALRLSIRGGKWGFYDGPIGDWTDRAAIVREDVLPMKLISRGRAWEPFLDIPPRGTKVRIKDGANLRSIGIGDHNRNKVGVVGDIMQNEDMDYCLGEFMGEDDGLGVDFPGVMYSLYFPLAFWKEYLEIVPA